MELDVNPRYYVVINGDIDNATFYGCNDCGAVVVDRSPHDFYHDELTEATAKVFELERNEKP